MTIQEFQNKYQGTYVASCGGITGQCVSLVQRWAEENGVSGCPVFPVAYAREMPGARPDFFNWIQNTPDGVPAPGDIVVLDGRWGGGAGHTGGVCTYADANVMDLFQQNDPYNSTAHVKRYTYNGCLGWLSFRKKPPTPQADNEGIVQAQGLRAHTEPNTTSNYPWYYDDQEHITLLKKTQGENVDGKWGWTNWWYLTDKGWVSDGFVLTTKNPANVPDYVPPVTPPPPPPVYSPRPLKGQFGIDVSAHQGKIDWNALKDSIDFAILKAGHTGKSYGGVQPNNADPEYARNVKDCGKPFGSYWYGYPSLDPKEEAQAFANVADKAGSLWLDLEEQSDTTNVAIWADAFMDNVELLTGKPCHLYTYFNYAKEHPQLKDVFVGTNRKLWLAHYGVKPGEMPPKTELPEPVMHQYSSTGNLPGIHPVDLNVYYGSITEFQDLANTFSTQPIQPPIIPQNPPDPNAPIDLNFLAQIIKAVIEFLSHLIPRKKG